MAVERFNWIFPRFKSLGYNNISGVNNNQDTRLRTSANFFIVSLAGADLLVSICVVPLAIVYQLCGVWLFGHKVCTVFTTLDIFCCTASIINLCAISLDRYWAIVTPFRYPRRMTHSTCVLMIFAVWACSIGIALVQLAWRYIIETDYNSSQCLITMDPKFRVVSSATSFYIPLIVMVFTYGCIYKVARVHLRAISNQKSEKKLVKFESTSEFSNGTYLSMPVLTHSRRESTLSIVTNSVKRCSTVCKQAREMKAFITLSIIMGVFIFNWFPFFVIYLVEAFCPRCNIPFWLQAIVLWAGYLNSAANPLIYFFRNRSYRQAFVKIFCKRCCNKFHKHDSPSHM